MPLVVSFQVEMSESKLRPDTVLTMICHKAAGLGESDSTDSVVARLERMADVGRGHVVVPGLF